MTSPVLRLTAALAAPLLALPALTGCSDPAVRTLTVIGPWVEKEESAFRQVLRDFRTKTGIQPVYQGTIAVNEVLRSKMQEGSPPDVAISWSPSELSQYARSGWLHSLNDVLRGQDRESYRRHWLLPEKSGGEIYAIPIKANIKSMIWYRTGALSGTPDTWTRLVETVKELAGERAPWCMALNYNPTAGWPGTDWIENILLHRSVEHYRAWAAGKLPWTSPEVIEAWKAWGEIAARSELLQGGTTRALLADFHEAGKSMSAEPHGCVLHHAPSYAMDDLRAGGRADGRPLAVGEDFDFFPFPSLGENQGSGGRAVNVSADLAVAFNGSRETEKFMAFLASQDAQRIWPSLPHSSAFSLDTRVSAGVYEDGVRKRMAGLLQAPENTLCFDASDSFPETMRTAFNRAVLEYVNDRDRLTGLLGELERVRASIDEEEWVATACDDSRK